ncbi:protein Turandot C-like [Drosophila takahashii]|uniref:protein Turandot C-like n=1 Tax=Drosophila takahashii TaxID=29030 RepID=UPI001CF8222D|nr:protein Turandot C-like [Drosophila takahashii]
MNLIVLTVCFALLLIGPLCSAYSDEELQADSLRLAEIIKTSPDDNTKIDRIPELLDIYRRMSPSLSPEERENLDRLIKPHTEELLIDGVPSQGGRRSKYRSGGILKPIVKIVAREFFTGLSQTITDIFSSWISRKNKP